MKKYLALAMVFSMLVLPAVSAANYFGINVNELQLFEKDSSWNIVPDGAYGLVKFTAVRTPWRIVQERVQVSVHDLEPKTMYQLIYYGDETHNDVYPYATCIGNPRMTSTQGYFKSGSAVFPHLSMWDDSIAQKFWVVPSSDVDCDAGVLTAWNPSEYLFEEHTI